MKTSINYICGSVYVEASIQRIALFPVLPNGKKAETKAKCSILTEDGKVFSFFADMQSKFLICSCWRRKMTRSNSITIPPVPAWIILPAKRSKRNPQKNQKYLSKERCFFLCLERRAGRRGHFGSIIKACKVLSGRLKFKRTNTACAGLRKVYPHLPDCRHFVPILILTQNVFRSILSKEHNY